MEMSEDYSRSEAIAISEGKEALKRAPWLNNRSVPNTEGFFFKLMENDTVHPNHYSISCVDGNGTKLFLSPWSGNYRLAPQDGIAMNANDMATAIRAYPDSLMIYMACQTDVEESYMGEIMRGFVNATEKIRIPNAPWDLNIGKLETATLNEMISLGIPGKGFDFGIVMTGFIKKDEVPYLNPQPGHKIIGVASTGMHSNGFTEGRHILLKPNSELEPREEWRKEYRGKYELHHKPIMLEGKTILEAMQVPTALYLVDAVMIGEELRDRDIYGVNITGNGLLNFNRVGHDVSFEITDPLPSLPIHELLVASTDWSPIGAYEKQNMGMGFSFITPTNLADRAVQIINERGENHAQIVGEVSKNKGKGVQTVLHHTYSGKQFTFKGYNN
jgi:phosphoribosylaminoimidazole (AIR) synthetase|tara:strand:- start:45 stop:1205 length:1161 start_codon:yes stop_codon:yes gene_type:complete